MGKLRDEYQKAINKNAKDQFWSGVASNFGQGVVQGYQAKKRTEEADQALGSLGIQGQGLGALMQSNPELAKIVIGQQLGSRSDEARMAHERAMLGEKYKQELPFRESVMRLEAGLQEDRDTRLHGYESAGREDTQAHDTEMTGMKIAASKEEGAAGREHDEKITGIKIGAAAEEGEKDRGAAAARQQTGIEADAARQAAAIAAQQAQQDKELGFKREAQQRDIDAAMERLQFDKRSDADLRNDQNARAAASQILDYYQADPQALQTDPGARMRVAKALDVLSPGTKHQSAAVASISALGSQPIDDKTYQGAVAEISRIAKDIQLMRAWQAKGHDTAVLEMRINAELEQRAGLLARKGIYIDRNELMSRLSAAPAEGKVQVGPTDVDAATPPGG